MKDQLAAGSKAESPTRKACCLLLPHAPSAVGKGVWGGASGGPGSSLLLAPFSHHRLSGAPPPAWVLAFSGNSYLFLGCLPAPPPPNPLIHFCGWIRPGCFPVGVGDRLNAGTAKAMRVPSSRHLHLPLLLHFTFSETFPQHSRPALPVLTFPQHSRPAVPVLTRRPGSNPWCLGGSPVSGGHPAGLEQ